MSVAAGLLEGLGVTQFHVVHTVLSSLAARACGSGAALLTVVIVHRLGLRGLGLGELGAQLGELALQAAALLARLVLLGLECSHGFLHGAALLVGLGGLNGLGKIGFARLKLRISRTQSFQLCLLVADLLSQQDGSQLRHLLILSFIFVFHSSPSRLRMVSRSFFLASTDVSA